MTDGGATYMSEERGKILAAVLGHIPFEGWTSRALRLAAEDAGLDPATAELAFPGGPGRRHSRLERGERSGDAGRLCRRRP